MASMIGIRNSFKRIKQNPFDVLGSLSFLLFYKFSGLLCSSASRADWSLPRMRNVTVDNRNLSCIVYNPPDCNGAGWKLNTTNGSYRTCTINNGSPSARLTFNGIAVYYSSAIFNNQSITFRLDGVSTPDVSISQPTVKPANSSASRLVWYKKDLENKGHTLELFPGKNGRTLYVDEIIYTSNSTADNVVSPSATPVRASAALDTQTVGIIFGSIIGSISGLILLALIAVMYRRRKELNSVRHHTAAALSPPSHFDFDARQPSHISHFTSEEASESHLAGASSPIRPLPSVPRERRFRTQSLYSHMEDIYEEQLSSSAVHGHSNPIQPTSSVASASVQQEPQRPYGRRVLALARQANDVALSSTRTYTKLEPLRKAAVRRDKF